MKRAAISLVLSRASLSASPSFRNDARWRTRKPIATNMKDCKQILSAVAAGNIKMTYGTTRRFMRIYRLARRLLRAGQIGGLVEIEIQFGRTLLLWNHPHSADLLVLFAGTDGARVSHVRGRCRMQRVEKGGLVIDDDPIVEEALVEFDNGITGRLSSKQGLHVVLNGTSGTLRIGDDGHWLELQQRNGLIRRTMARHSMSGTVKAFHGLADAVRHDDKTSIAPHEIGDGLAILLSIARSALVCGDPISPDVLEEAFTVTGRYGTNYAAADRKPGSRAMIRS